MPHSGVSGLRGVRGEERATRLDGSSRSPKTMAPAMHASAHIGVASASTPGPRPRAEPSSTRSLQKVHLVMTPWRSGRAWAASDGVGASK